MRKSVASIALISREAHGQTLWLAQWNQGWRSFSFVGGHKREQESFRECVIREIEEELGLREGQDVRIALTPLKAVAYIDVSRRTGEETEYDIALLRGEPDRSWRSDRNRRQSRQSLAERTRDPEGTLR